MDDSDFEVLAADGKPATKAATKAAKAEPAPAKDRIKIVLEENDEIPPTGLYVGLNGVGYLLRPAEPIEVPAGIVEILDNAVMSMPHLDPQTRQVVGWRQRMRYPYRRV
jgi:hypothetical protein